MDFDLEMDADSPTTSHPQPLRPPEPSRGPSSASYPPASSHPPQAALGPSSSASSSTSAPTQSPQPSLRFPSSFADFKLPTSPIVANSQAQATFAYHPPPNNDGGPSSSSSVFATGLAHGAQVSVNGGPGAMDLAAKRARRGSLLSLNNHYRAGGQDEQRPTSPLAAAPSTSSFTFGIPSSTSNSSTFSSTSTARPSTPPANGHWGSSLAREGRTHSAQSSSSMMISPPASHKVLSRPTSPMATLNPPSFPPSFREVMSSPKIGSHRLESGRLGASGSGSAGEREQGQNEEQMDMGDRDRITSRPITRTRNLKPQIKRTTTLLAAEATPVDFYRAEASQEADWRRKTTSMPMSPASLKLRSTLGGTSGSGANQQHRLQAGRFPEDVDDDIFADGLGGQSSGSSDDDDGMDDGAGTDGEGSVGVGSVTSTSIRERTSFGSLGGFGFGRGGDSSATPPPSFVPVPGFGHRMSMSGNVSGGGPDGAGDGSMMMVSSPVLGAGMASPVGTPGSTMGWRDSGKAGNKRKAADDRFDPYKRRAVSPSTVLFPSSSSTTNTTTHTSNSHSPHLNHPNPSTSTSSASALPPHTYSSSSATSSSGLASPIHSHPTPLPPHAPHNLTTSTTAGPIPIKGSSQQQHYTTTTRGSRPGSPVMAQAYLSSSAGGNGVGMGGRSLGGMSSFTGLVGVRERGVSGNGNGGGSGNGSGSGGGGEDEVLVAKMRLGE